MAVGPWDSDYELESWLEKLNLEGMRIWECLSMFRISLVFMRQFWRGMVFLLPIWLTMCGLVVGLGVVLAEVENWALRDALYFSWVTGLTVGYGDLAPVQPLGRLCALCAALIGIIFSGLWVALAVDALRRAFHELGERKV